jgi:hypothetical protein
MLNIDFQNRQPGDIEQQIRLLLESDEAVLRIDNCIRGHGIGGEIGVIASKIGVHWMSIGCLDETGTFAKNLPSIMAEYKAKKNETLIIFTGGANQRFEDRAFWLGAARRYAAQGYRIIITSYIGE